MPAPTYPTIPPPNAPSPGAPLLTFDVLYASDMYVRQSEKPSLSGRDVKLCVEEALRILVGEHEWQSMKKSRFDCTSNQR